MLKLLNAENFLNLSCVATKFASFLSQNLNPRNFYLSFTIKIMLSILIGFLVNSFEGKRKEDNF